MRRDEHLKKFGARLKVAREQAALSQQELADKVHTSKSMISSYENGTCDPRQSIIPPLADVLNVSIKWLMLGDEDENQAFSSIHDLPFSIVCDAWPLMTKEDKKLIADLASRIKKENPDY